MFEKRLRALTYALGVTFLILIVLHIISFIWVILFSSGMFDFASFLNIVSPNVMVGYILNLKIVVVFFGTLFLICWLWSRKLREISEE